MIDVDVRAPWAQRFFTEEAAPRLLAQHPVPVFRRDAELGLEVVSASVEPIPLVVPLDVLGVVGLAPRSTFAVEALLALRPLLLGHHRSRCHALAFSPAPHTFATLVSMFLSPFLLAQIRALAVFLADTARLTLYASWHAPIL